MCWWRTLLVSTAVGNRRGFCQYLTFSPPLMFSNATCEKDERRRVWWLECARIIIRICVCVCVILVSLSIFRRSRLRFWQQYQELRVLFCAKCGHYRLVNKVHHRLGKLSIMFGWRRFDLYINFINNDLAGFIKSVPQTWLLYAVHSDSLTHEWQNRRSEISVDLSQKGVALRIHFLDLFVPPVSERISVRHRYSSLV